MALITKKFFSNIKDKGHKGKILSQLECFERVLVENKEIIREIPKGFWIRKIKDTSIFKFRLNSGDRILYTYIENRENRKEKEILFLSYCDHNSQIRTGKNMDLNSKKNKVNKLEINYQVYDEMTEIDKEINNEYSKYDSDLEEAYIYVVDDNTIATMINNKNTDYLYYLSDEQLTCLKDIDKPLILTGAAGSGKSTIALYKLLGLKNKKVLYITYTELLCDKIKGLYNKFNKKNSKNFVEFSTVKNFCVKNLKAQNQKLVSYENFIEWINSNRNILNYKIFKNIDMLNIWTEIQGIIKGHIGVDNKIINLNKNKEIFELTMDEYMSMPVKYSIFNEEDKQEIYKLYKEYKKWCIENNYKDANDLAYDCVNNSKKDKYDYVIVDEVQDLSEVQIVMISNLVTNKNNIMYCGDIHQIVNPTFFKFGRLKNIYYANDISMEVKSLSKNYRNTIEIIDTLNNLMRKRQEIAGKTSYDYLETGIRHGETPKLLDISDNELYHVLDSIKDRHYCAIVVPNDKEKEKLEKINPKASGRIFTVSEIKGLEYENIYCINFISSNEKEWRGILNSKEKNESYRYYFNLLYVALSRGINNVFLYEKNIKLFNEVGIIKNEVSKDINEKSLKIEEVSTKQEWKKEAERLNKVYLKTKGMFAIDKTKEKFIKDINKSADKMYSSYFESQAFDEVKATYCGKNKFIKLGFERFQRRDYGKAIEFYKKALEQEPDNFKIYYHIANAYGYMTGGEEIALTYFDKAIELNDRFYLAYIDKASILIHLKRRDNAIEEYLKASKIEPNAITAWGSLTRDYYGKYKETGDKTFLKVAKDANDKALIANYNYTYDSHNKIWGKASMSEIKAMKKDFKMQKIHFTNLLDLKVNAKPKVDKSVDEGSVMDMLMESLVTGMGISKEELHAIINK